MQILGILLWMFSIHLGIYSDASTILPPPITDFGDDPNLKYEPSLSNGVISALTGHITEKDLNSSVNFAMNIVGFMKRLETTLMWSDIKVKSGTPSHGEYISFAPEQEAVKRGREALIAFKATLQLSNSFCNKVSKHNRQLNQRECSMFMLQYNLNKTPLRQSCTELSKQCPIKEYLSQYRSIDGRCNHASKGAIGESFTAYSRLVYPNYLDGVHELRRSVTKKELPSPRVVVDALIRNDDRPDEHATLAVMQWGQFLEHDLSRTAVAISVHTDRSIECCGEEGYNLSPRYIHPFCSPIYVPSNDKAYGSKGINCLSYVRSVLALRLDCSFGPTEQMNQATHFLDGSQIYGSSTRKSASLRAFIYGKLDIQNENGGIYLPQSQNPTMDCQLASKNSTCFKSGDSRVNFQPQLTVMHTIWFREHNRITNELATLNPHWDDETLFQEARKIVIAEMQHITYNEWIGTVLEPSYVHRIQNLEGYNDNINPAVSNSFANAAMRSLKSLYDGKLRLYNEDRSINESINLRHYFNNPTIIKQHGVLDALLRGLATQHSQKLDIFYAKDLIDYLYTNGNFGFDVLSFDVQRGRDHGLPAYGTFRDLCDLSAVKSFSDLRDIMSKQNVNILSNVYSSVQDIDLIIGGLLETPRKGAIFGPTFSCIVADQFRRTKLGDRYFYTNVNQPKPFTTEQLDQIRKVTLARVFCDNSDGIITLQPNVFKVISESNKLAECYSEAIPHISFQPWLESSTTYY